MFALLTLKWISDLLAGMIGSLGLMPAAQFNKEDGFALFEPTHGSAPDIKRIRPGL